MQTYIAPIGYDTRRVTRPVVHNGIHGGDTVVLVRPANESDTEQAQQAIADVDQLLHEIEPSAEVVVERLPTGTLDSSIPTCCELVDAASGDCVVSLGGGARDVLLPLLLAAVVRTSQVDRVLFFSDLDHSVQEWNLPNLTACPPKRTGPTLDALRTAEQPLSLAAIAESVGQSKSTIVRHVNDLDDRGVVTTHTEGKTKYVELSLTGRLLALAAR